LPHAEVIATDASAAALKIARRNATRNHVAHRIRFIEADLLALPASEKSPAPFFDLIVSNPPYIADSDAASLQREVRDHEPHSALFAGPTGNEIYERLVGEARDQLRDRGVLVLELGHNSAEPVRAMFDASSASWTNVSITMDLAGVPRILAAERIR
jgi:release factor glutamine methyltransferase